MAPPPNLAALLETRIFPQMTIRESRLIREFLRRRGDEWDSADVEARIGRGVILPPTVTERDRVNWAKRTRARPDLVLQRAPNVVAIVEAKEQLTNEGIWQVLSYRDLWIAERPGDDVQPIAIAEAATPNAITLALAQRVQVFLYEFDPAAPLAPGEAL